MNHSEGTPKVPSASKMKPILLFLVASLPALTTFLAFVWPRLPHLAYPAGKVLMGIVPVLWIAGFRIPVQEAARRWGFRFRAADLAWGLLTGLFISAGLWLLYLALFRGTLEASGILATLPAPMLEHFWLSALAVSLGNSLLEEYFWRGFWLRGMADRFGPRSAVALNGLFFGVHHLILLGSFFPFAPALLFTLGTSVGGWLWSWMRMRGLSLAACYVSHLLVDLALMAIGYDLLFL